MFETIRQPEYTGRNRCLPCTVLNVSIALLLSTVPVLTNYPSGVYQMVGATIIFLPSIFVIYLRGYLLPGTPELTKRYFPSMVLRLFGKQPTFQTQPKEPSPLSNTDSSEIAPEVLLQDIGALKPCSHMDDLCLTDQFRESWNAEIDAIQEGEVTGDAIPRQFGFPEAEYTIEEYEESWVLTRDSYTLGNGHQKQP